MSTVLPTALLLRHDKLYKSPATAMRPRDQQRGSGSKVFPDACTCTSAEQRMLRAQPTCDTS